MVRLVARVRELRISYIILERKTVMWKWNVFHLSYALLQTAWITPRICVGWNYMWCSSTSSIEYGAGWLVLSTSTDHTAHYPLLCMVYRADLHIVIAEGSMFSKWKRNLFSALINWGHIEFLCSYKYDLGVPIVVVLCGVGSFNMVDQYVEP